MRQLVIVMLLCALPAPSGFGESTNYAAKLESLFSQYQTQNGDLNRVAAELTDYKATIAKRLKSDPTEMAGLTNYLRTQAAMDGGISEFALTELLGVVARVDEKAFLDVAEHIIFDSTVAYDRKRPVMSKIYGHAIGVGDEAFRKRTIDIMERTGTPPYPSKANKLHYSALSLLTGSSGLGVKGLDPERGKPILRQIVRNPEMPFSEKERFAFLLASVDASFLDYYERNVRTLYLEDEKRHPEHKLLYAEKLSDLGRFPKAELEALRKAGRYEGEQVIYTNGVIVTPKNSK